MTCRRHVNLFVPDSPAGAICSSVIHEWAQGKYDSVTVRYCSNESIEEDIHHLTRLISIAQKEQGDPCSQRLIIVIGFYLSDSCINKLLVTPNTSFKVHDAWLDPEKQIMKRYFGFFKSRWPSGFRKFYQAISSSSLINLYGFNWRALRDFYEVLGADELEKCLTAYLHDLKPREQFDVYDMEDYYFQVFKERKTE